MKKILILGAGIYQVPLIRQAREMGLEVIVSSIAGNYPGFQYANKVYHVNTVDQEAILRMASEEKISGIVTTGTDVAVKTIGYVCDKMHLFGISEKCAEAMSNKALMKKVMAEYGVRTPLFKQVSSVEEAVAAAEEIGFPVMIKCVDRSGSRGIQKANDTQEIQSAFDYAMSYTDLSYVLVEEFVDGYEIGLDGYVGQTQQQFWPHNKIVFHNGLTDVPIGHSMPIQCEERVYDDIIKQAQLAVKAFGCSNVFVNMDIMISRGKAYIIELGARCGATCIPEVLSRYYGWNIYEKMIQNALGEKVVFENNKHTPCIAQLLTSNRSGVIKKIYVPSDIKALDVSYSFDYKVGDQVNQFVLGPDRVGQVIASGKTLQDAQERLLKAKNMIEIEVQ